jgi:uncharacterized SAM-binding protein YcdF (DUF218 family)
MLIALKMVLHTVLLPPAGPLLLAVLGICLARWCRGGWARVGWALLAAALAALWLLATPLVAEALARAAQRYPPLDLTRPVRAEAIVVLGGYGSRPHAREYAGEPAAAANLLERVTYAGFLAQRLQLPILVSGAARETASMSATLARVFNITVRWSEPNSRDTFENARFSAQLLRAAGVRRILLVTDAGHEWRAAHEFASAGLEVVPAPEGFSDAGETDVFAFLPNAEALVTATEALYEMLGDFARRSLAVLGLRRQPA